MCTVTNLIANLQLLLIDVYFCYIFDQHLFPWKYSKDMEENLGLVFYFMKTIFFFLQGNHAH